MNLDEMIELALAARGPEQPRQIRVARDLYDALKREAADQLAYPTASVASSVYGIPIVIDDELPPGEHRVDPARNWWER